MDLILWRHAEAHELRGQQGDLERALTTKGERQAKRMADWLNHRIAHSTRVLVSPALRCQQTVKALGRDFRTVDSLGPDADGGALLKAARWPDANEPVLIVGHQPTLGLLASYLLTGVPQPWVIKKGAVWWLRSRDREGQAQTVLQAVQAPDGL
jgi:phosphohistidine phosphatase